MDSNKSFAHHVKSLEQRLNEVKSEKDAYEKDISAYAKENQDLKEQIFHLRSTLKNADAKAIKTLKEVQDLHHQKAELLEDEHKRSLIEKNNIIGNLRESIKSLKQDLEKCKLLDKENQFSKTKADGRIASLRDKVNELEQKSSDKEQKLNLIQTEQKKKASQQQVRISVLEDQLRSMRSEKRVQNDELVQVKLKLATHQNQKQAETSKLDDELKDLQKQVKALSKDLQEKKYECNQVSEQVRHLESKNESLKRQKQDQLVHKDDEILELRAKLREKDGEICSLSNRVTSFEKNDERNFNKHSAHVDRLQSEMEQRQSENNAKKEKLRKYKRELEHLQSESRSQESQHRVTISSLEKKIANLRSENRQKDEEVALMSSKLGNLEAELDSHISKEKFQKQTWEEKSKRLEKELKQKSDELLNVKSQLVNQQMETESMTSQKNTLMTTLKEKASKLEAENQKKEEQLCKVSTKLAHSEMEVGSVSSGFRVRVRTLEEKLAKIQTEVNVKDEKIIKLESALFDKNDEIQSLKRKAQRLETESKKQESQVNGQIAEYKDKLALALENAENLQCKVETLFSVNQLLKTDLEQANNLKKNLALSLEDLSEKLKKSKKNEEVLEENSSSVCSKFTQAETQLKTTIDEQKLEITELNSCISDLKEKLDNVKSDNRELREKCEALEVDNSAQSTLKTQTEQYKQQLHEMQRKHSQLVSQQNDVNIERTETLRKLDMKEKEHRVLADKLEELSKTNDLLKESCLLLEQQVESLESFNNELIEKQHTLTFEKDEALKKCSELRMELTSSKHDMEEELTSLDQCKGDQIAELKVELRNEMNQLHEISEEHRDLELKYKNLELHAAALQRKLNAEKDGRERSCNEVKRIQADKEILQQSLKRAEENLHSEIDRCDFLEREKTKMINRMDTDKLEYSHELVRLNCQGAQQTKLIDFLQSRVEELEPSDKKKKKKKTTLYQAPLQYRELQVLLDEEKTSNVKLQEQVNQLRSELQSTNSKVKRLKHGMEVPLSPGSIAAISAIVKSPATKTTEGAVSPKSGKLRSKPRMQHNIPHRLSSWVCHRATRCSVCLVTIHFGHSAFRCSQCSVACHSKCKRSITNTCGLPGGLFQHFREAPKPSNLSPITCVFKGNNSDQLHGRLKVLCGDDTWIIRSVRVCSNQVRIAPHSAKSPSKMSDKDDVIDLKQGAYVHTDLNQSELPNTTKQDLSYTFKIQTGSSNSCWPARSIYFLAAGFAEKHMWVEKLESIIAEHSQSKKTDGNAKIFGNEILALLNDEKLDLNCSLPISNKSILFGCDEGLFHLSPSTTSVSSKADMKKIEGFTSMYQLTPLNKSTVLAIEGSKHRVISFSSSSIMSPTNVAIHSVEDLEGCHLFSLGHAEGLPYLCVATATSITILKYNEKLKKFCKRKEIATSEPCTCMMFTACSVIIGTNTFYEADLTEFKIDEFMEESILAQFGEEDNFPVSILKVKDQEGKQEFLLCFHEFGIFVDGFGRQTRSGRITWSRMPLSFEFRSPYLIIVQFNSIEIILLDVEGLSSADNCKMDRAYLSFPKARFLGSAITEGAVYLSSSEGNKISVFCCKGNMKVDQRNVKATASKRHYAALSSSVDSLSSPTTKKSTIFSDLSSMSSLKSSTRILSQSEQSLYSDTTSRWTTTCDSDDTCEITVMRTSESDLISSSNEESASSESIAVPHHRRIQWRPAKTPPPKPKRKGVENYDPISSTQV